MPELPEVETIKRGLAKNIIGKKIIDFDCDWQKLINYQIVDYRLKIKDLKIKDVKRRAKMIILDLSNGLNILVHLKMTGQLVYGSKTKCVVGGHPIKESYNCLPNKFTHATFYFSDKSKLYFNDVRKFGWLKLYTDNELEKEIARLNLGPEPLSRKFTLEYFKQSIKTKPRSKIKQFLMNPNNLVGVGNIYADEACYFAKVKPTRLNKTLKNKEIELLYQGIIKILKASIRAHGTTFSDFRNADGESGNFSKQLQVYGRHGQNCYGCKKIIKKIKLGGRTASYCSGCQK